MEHNTIYHNIFNNPKPWFTPESTFYPDSYPIHGINVDPGLPVTDAIFSNQVLNSLDPDHSLIEKVKSYTCEYISEISTTKHTWTILTNLTKGELQDQLEKANNLRDFLDSEQCKCNYHRVLFLDNCLILELYFKN